MNIASQKQAPFVQFLQLAILYAYAFTYLERTLFQAQKNQFGPVITILGPIHLSARKESIIESPPEPATPPGTNSSLGPSEPRGEKPSRHGDDTTGLKPSES